MAEDRYRLEPIRDARARDERAKKTDLAAAVGDARATEERLTHMRARTEAARAALTDARAMPASASAGAFALADRFVARRRKELAAAIDELARAGAVHGERLGAIDAARTTLARARAERELIERHFARWRAERKKLAERRDD